MRKTEIRPCALCGVRHQDPARALGHLLVAHGPLNGAGVRRRKRIKSTLPQIHRRLEEVGFGEAQAHLIIRVIAEEFRKLGMV